MKLIILVFLSLTGAITNASETEFSQEDINYTIGRLYDFFIESPKICRTEQQTPGTSAAHQLFGASARLNVIMKTEKVRGQIDIIKITLETDKAKFPNSLPLVFFKTTATVHGDFKKVSGVKRYAYSLENVFENGKPVKKYVKSKSSVKCKRHYQW